MYTEQLWIDIETAKCKIVFAMTYCPPNSTTCCLQEFDMTFHHMYLNYDGIIMLCETETLT